MSVNAELVSRGAWEAARLRQYDKGSINSNFLCRVVVGDKTLTGILRVRKREEGGSNGSLLIPMEATDGSVLAAQVEGNRYCFVNPDDNYAIAEGLGLVFHKTYRDLIVSSLGGGRDRLGVENNLTVSNLFSRSAPEATEPGDVGAAMGLAQHIVASLPGGWQITPEPVISQ